MKEQDEDFGKYEDLRRLAAVSGDVVDTPRLLSNPDSADVMGNSRKRKRNSENQKNGDSETFDGTKGNFGLAEFQTDSRVQGLSGAYPMHENCCTVAIQYIQATNRKGDRMMKMEGVASWVNLYRDLQAHWSLRQKGYMLAHQYGHGYHGAADFQGQEWMRTKATKVSCKVKILHGSTLTHQNPGLRSLTDRQLIHEHLPPF